MSVFYSVFFYFRHLILAKSIYRIHSPFAYDFIDKVFCNPQAFNQNEIEVMDKIEHLRHQYLNNSEKIFIQDCGTKKSRYETIKAITRKSSSGKNKALFLYRLVKYFGSKNIIELGTNLGFGAAYMTSANINIKLLTVEASDQLFFKAQSLFNSLNLKNIRAINDTFENIIPQILKTNTTFDFLVIDGNHSYAASMNYFMQFVQYKNDNSIIYFDDINYSQGMRKAWRQVTEHHAVTLSIDFYFGGLVFFNPRLSKQKILYRLNPFMYF